MNCGIRHRARHGNLLTTPAHADSHCSGSSLRTALPETSQSAESVAHPVARKTAPVTTSSNIDRNCLRKRRAKHPQATVQQSRQTSFIGKVTNKASTNHSLLPLPSNPPLIQPVFTRCPLRHSLRFTKESQTHHAPIPSRSRFFANVPRRACTGSWQPISSSRESLQLRYCRVPRSVAALGLRDR